MTASISFAVIGLFRFLLLLHSVLEDYIFLEMCPFHLGFQISWHTVLRSNFLLSFGFLWYCRGAFMQPTGPPGVKNKTAKT